MKFVFLLLALSQTVYSAPVTDRLGEDTELDPWLTDIEQALEREIPEPEGTANIHEGRPASDRNGKLASREDPVDDMEEKVAANYHGGQDHEETETKIDNLGYEPDDVKDQSSDHEQHVNSTEYLKPQAENMETSEKPELSQYKSTFPSELADEQQTETVVDVNNSKIQKLTNKEPSHVSALEDTNKWRAEELPEQGYYMEMTGDNEKETDDSKEPWKEPSGPEDFDEPEFNDESFKNNDMKGDSVPNVNRQPVDYPWEVPGPKQFDDEFKSNAMGEDIDANGQSNDMNIEYDDEQQPEYKDLGVVEDVSVNVDHNDILDGIQPEIMANDEAVSAQGICIKSLYIMAFTSNWKHSGSDSAHEVEIRAGGYTYKSLLPNLPGDDYQPSKGDLWKLSLENNFNIRKCVTPNMVDYIAIEESSNDGWNIDSIVSFFIFDSYNSKLATVNLDAYHWVDGDGADSHRRFELTKMY